MAQKGVRTTVVKRLHGRPHVNGQKVRCLHGMSHVNSAHGLVHRTSVFERLHGRPHVNVVLGRLAGWQLGWLHAAWLPYGPLCLFTYFALTYSYICLTLLYLTYLLYVRGLKK